MKWTNSFHTTFEVSKSLLHNIHSRSLYKRVDLRSKRRLSLLFLRLYFFSSASTFCFLGFYNFMIATLVAKTLRVLSHPNWYFLFIFNLFQFRLLQCYLFSVTCFILFSYFIFSSFWFVFLVLSCVTSMIAEAWKPNYDFMDSLF